MKLERVYVDYLQDILDHAQKAVSFLQGMSGDDFLVMKRPFLPSSELWK